MKKNTFLSIILISFFGTAFFLQSCDFLNTAANELPYAVGYGIDGSTDNNATIQDDVQLGTAFSTENLPKTADLLDYFPPIGDQGSYGTCTAWATAYNCRTFLDAKSTGVKNPSTTDKMYSPKDLFWSIAEADKGADCNGTDFVSAFDVMISRGVATLATVPYEDLGDCSSSPQSAWTTDAAKHKIESFREIDVDKATIKSNLANGKAVVFGAKLGDEFMNANSDEVLNFQTYGYTGQHAYHAMIICGYDDDKGPNGAFRVVNSWGTSWGDDGYIWIDQDYFCTAEFCFGAYVANVTASDPDDNNDNIVDDPASGLDLMAWQLYDVDYKHNTDLDANDPRWRVAVYNVYNTGDQEIKAAEDWSIIYLLYNAYDGEDYQIVLFDYYSDDNGSLGENGLLTNYTDVTAQGMWWNYVNVPSTYSCARAVYENDPNADPNNNPNAPFNWTYQLPLVTGDYYLVIIADGFDQFAEFDEDNNCSYYTYENGDPLHLENGVIDNPPLPPTGKSMLKSGKPYKGQASDFPTVKIGKNINAYTEKEIAQMIKRQQKSGELKRKAMEFAKTHEKQGTKTQYKM